MIKDSKLIGTKIAAPYGWKKFKVGELFDFVRSDTPRLGSFVSNDTVFLIKATSSNNGVDSVFKSYTGLCYKNILTIGMRGSFKVFLHTSAVVLGDNVAGFKLKDITYSSSNRVLLFLGCLLEKLYSYGSGYAGYPTWSKLESHDVLSIPVRPNSQPDFAWMAQYMKLVQEDYLQQKKLSNQSEIKAYLTESQTNSLKITDDDREFLREFDKLPRRKFKVGELFDYKSSKSLNKGDLTFVSSNSEFSIPYITRTVLNNGINGYVDSRFLSPEYINNGSEFAFGLMGLTAFYQSGTYCTGQFVKRFVPKFKINSLLALYFKTMLDRQIEMFKTVSIRSYDSLINGVIYLELPVLLDLQVDVESIERYMRIQVKLTIIKRKSYLDRELKLMEQMS